MHISKGHRVDNCVRTRADRSRQGAKLVAIEYDEPCAPPDQIIGRWATASVGQSHVPAMREKLVADRSADLACATYDESASSHESKFVAGQAGHSQLHFATDRRSLLARGGMSDHHLTALLLGPGG